MKSCSPLAVAVDVFDAIGIDLAIDRLTTMIADAVSSCDAGMIREERPLKVPRASERSIAMENYQFHRSQSCAKDVTAQKSQRCRNCLKSRSKSLTLVASHGLADVVVAIGADVTLSCESDSGAVGGVIQWQLRHKLPLTPYRSSIA